MQGPVYNEDLYYACNLLKTTHEREKILTFTFAPLVNPIKTYFKFV